MKAIVLIMVAFVVLLGLMSTWFFVRPVSGTQETLREIDSLNSALAEEIVCPVIPAVVVEPVVDPDYSVIPQTLDSDSLLTLAGAMPAGQHHGGRFDVIAMAPDVGMPMSNEPQPSTLSEEERQRLRQYEIDRRKEVFDILNGNGGE